ncbi:MAG: hypothetical protein Kow0099_23790 [Candidatus Abyssubacteria bacterium]
MRIRAGYVVRVIGVILITLVFLEIFSVAYVSFILGLGYRELEIAKLESLHQSKDAEMSELKFLRDKGQLHPYFGYTSVAGWGNRNNSGFITLDGRDYPYAADSDEFVVGIFGGSVARQIYLMTDNPEIFQASLMPVLKEKGYNRVTLLNFAVSAYHEPQSLFVLLYYLRTVDMAIFIEGYNEVVFTPDREDYPVSFPWILVWGPLVGKGLSSSTMETVGRLTLINEKEEKWTRLFVTPVMRQSMFCHLLWKARINHLSKVKNGLRIELKDGLMDDLSYARLVPPGFEHRDRIEMYIEDYISYLRTAHYASLAADVPSFFVLQPNQYLEGSKTLSKKEINEYVTAAETKETVNLYYPQLRKVYTQLAAEGLNTIDLTQVFANEKGTTYSDSCCHVNSKGRTIIREAIIDEILQREKWKTVIPRASERPNRLIRQ